MNRMSGTTRLLVVADKPLRWRMIVNGGFDVA